MSGTGQKGLSEEVVLSVFGRKPIEFPGTELGKIQVGGTNAPNEESCDEARFGQEEKREAT
jgi:hypothetical protein